MRVGANVRQFARIKKMHAEGTPAPIIAKTIQMTDQSLEKILAAIDGRKEKHLATENNPEVNAMRLQNAELAARLAKYEDPQSGEAIQHGDAEVETEEEQDPEAVETGEEEQAEETA
jgi:hypothetical protein